MDKVTKWLVSQCQLIFSDPSRQMSYDAYLRAKHNRTDISHLKTSKDLRGTLTNK